ncbi:MAG: ribonuclease H-like domain-containing protein [Clostridia bacterium]|nr:ribonuclease H-like domain-containing protein [Clostridia bacterium]
MEKDIVDILNENTGGKFGFKFKSATLEKSTSICHVELFYNDGVILSQEERTNAENIVKNNLPKNFNYEIKFIKNFVVNESLKNSLKSYLHKNFPSILCEIGDVDCEGENKRVVVLIDERVVDYLSARNVKKETEKYLQESFYAHIDVEFKVKKELEDVKEEAPEIDFFNIIPDIRYIEVSNVEPIVGDLTETNAFYIKDKKSPEENVVFCGKMVYLKEHSYTPKRKAKEEDSKAQDKPSENEQAEVAQEGESEQVEEKSAPKEKKLYKFVLEDFTGKINCVIFETKSTAEQLTKLEANGSYIVSGKLEEDKFSGGVTMRVKNISRCTLPETFQEEIHYKPEPKSYRWVFPEKYESYAQDDIFNLGTKKEVNEFLMENDVVVFDFETTGLDKTGKDFIIEIGAVKVHKGKITEKFMSYVEPEIHISSEITGLTGITNEDVEGAPSYEQVLADFYKFTRNSYLSGYNIIGFDCYFLDVFGRLSGYNFDNKVIDVFKLAQKEVKGTKNLKLGTVAEAVGVVLDNAHRAVYDAIATAEILIKISETAEITE